MTQDLIEKYLQDINSLGFEKSLILNSHDVAKILKVQTRTIINWAKENIGPKCKKIGKSYLYTKRDIAEFLATK
ncbi:helix-turn-helix domain-containing protein [Aliarcobacter cryaerophilus]|mgnify:CR=1 FL=1|jgi:hypothetical protein|uniref:helix-turn-helix domain-containing protein n=1 Tax=Aliarcobacter cryaerophilus TaxID=28198 RepID=UPI0021B5C444|nr:helix-turn-helix domain-containing protein [Aliarcobacter cryaerophilus]MCT7462094.1 helix-turn-helix domain-containing protein [Aliarcobacter cryaerophilus]